MRRALLFLALVALAGGCGGPPMSRVKGRLVANGQPMTFPPTSAAVMFSPLAPDGKPDPSRGYSCVVNEDGSFELIASGGELPVGNYQVSIQAQGKLAAQLKPFAGTGSLIRRELKPGPNEVTIDVSRPDGG